MLSRSSARTAEWCAVATIVLLAAWLRLSWLDQVEFLWDQAEISKWAIELAREGRLLPVGPVSSTGIDSFPAAIWLLAIPYAISLSPIVATGFIGLLNVAAVVGCYLLGRRWLGRGAALAAALLFAVAPWGVIYSRKVWHTELLAPLAVLYAATGWAAFVRGKRWALLAHAGALVLLVQTHFSAAAMVPLTALWALVFIRRLDLRVAAVAFLLCVLSFLPYLVRDSQQGWENSLRFAELMRRPAETDGDAACAVWVISTGTDLHWLTGPDHYPRYVDQTPNARWLFTVEGFLILAGAGAALLLVTRSARSGLDDRAAGAFFAVTWLAAPALFQTRHVVPVAPHYLSPTLPAQFLLVGLLFDEARRLPRRFALAGQGLVAGLVFLIAAAQIYEVTSLLSYVFNHDTLRGYGTPIHYEIEAAETAVRLAREAEAAEVVLLAEGEDPRMHEMANVADTLLYETPHRTVDARTALVLPAQPAVYWATYDASSPGEALLGALAPEVTSERILLREGLRSFRFYNWSADSVGLLSALDLELVPLGSERIAWSNGAQLEAAGFSGDARPGEALHWTLVWRTMGQSSHRMYYHWFNHLIDDAGQLRGQMDGPSYLPAYWRAGDTVVNWFSVPIPPELPAGSYAMRVGMYAYPGLETVPLADGEEWIVVGPVEIGG